jgi:hypothetical protein
VFSEYSKVFIYDRTIFFLNMLGKMFERNNFVKNVHYTVFVGWCYIFKPEKNLKKEKNNFF